MIKKSVFSIIIFLFSINNICSQNNRTISSPEFHITPCDKLYAVEMQNILSELKGRLSPSLLKMAEEYMILLKQKEDLEYRIRLLDYYLFNLALTLKINKPLQEFYRCRSYITTRAPGIKQP